MFISRKHLKWYNFNKKNKTKGNQIFKNCINYLIDEYLVHVVATHAIWITDKFMFCFILQTHKATAYLGKPFNILYLKDIPGVGRATECLLREMGVNDPYSLRALFRHAPSSFTATLKANGITRREGNVIFHALKTHAAMHR